MGRRLASWAAPAGPSLVLFAVALVASCHSPPAREQLIADHGGRPHAAAATCATPLDAELRRAAPSEDQLHLNAYILADDDVGQEYREALSERARAGVAVRMMFDSVGALDAGSEYRKALAKAGVELHEYASINPLEEPELWRIAQRNHRKLLVVDGRVAFTGGIGISDVYSQSPVPSSSPSTQTPALPGWHGNSPAAAIGGPTASPKHRPRLMQV